MIFSLEDETEEFHNTLAILYKDLYIKLHTQLNLTHSEGNVPYILITFFFYKCFVSPFTQI